jgi:hypothetical protein
MSNKRVDRLEVGANAPKSPNDEVVWIDSDANSISRYDEATDSWVSVGSTVSGANFVLGPSNARTGVGEVLQFTDGAEQSVITGPMPTVSNSTAQRLVVAGQDGLVDTSGEGGDLYLWAGVGGSGNGSGGDIKVDAGNGGGTTGGGGTVKVRGGDSTESSGGYVRIEGGDSDSGYGGDVDIYGGYSNSEPGGDIDMTAGYSSASVGGNVFIEAGNTSTGLGGSIRIQAFTAGKITLIGDGGEFLNDNTIADNQIATLGDISGATGTFETSDSKLVTVTNGLITAIDPLT